MTTSDQASKIAGGLSAEEVRALAMFSKNMGIWLKPNDITEEMVFKRLWKKTLIETNGSAIPHYRIIALGQAVLAAATREPQPGAGEYKTSLEECLNEIWRFSDPDVGGADDINDADSYIEMLVGKMSNIRDEVTDARKELAILRRQLEQAESETAGLREVLNKLYKAAHKVENTMPWDEVYSDELKEGLYDLSAQIGNAAVELAATSNADGQP